MEFIPWIQHLEFKGYQHHLLKAKNLSSSNLIQIYLPVFSPISSSQHQYHTTIYCITCDSLNKLFILCSQPLFMPVLRLGIFYPALSVLQLFVDVCISPTRL